jgi:hypothetical protein
MSHLLFLLIRLLFCKENNFFLPEVTPSIKSPVKIAVKQCHDNAGPLWGKVLLLLLNLIINWFWHKPAGSGLYASHADVPHLPQSATHRRIRADNDAPVRTIQKLMTAPQAGKEKGAALRQSPL